MIKKYSRWSKQIDVLTLSLLIKHSNIMIVRTHTDRKVIKIIFSHINSTVSGDSRLSTLTLV